MRLFKKKSNHDKMIELVTEYYENCNNRIENGDLDIDDVLYKGRDAAARLLAVASKQALFDAIEDMKQSLR